MEPGLDYREGKTEHLAGLRAREILQIPQHHDAAVLHRQSVQRPTQRLPALAGLGRTLGIVKSQLRTRPSPRYVAAPRKAASNVSWRTSSATLSERTMLRMKRSRAEEC